MRIVSPEDFIQLPPLGETGTLTLVDELEGTARTEGKLPAGIVAALTRLLEQTSELERALAARARSGSSADPRARAADRALDDAWGAFQSWLLGWTRLPERAHPRVTDARRLYAGLFPKGLQFLTLDFKDEWTESQNRLDQIVAHGLEQLVAELGGTPFFDEITTTHKSYGAALHITGQDVTPEPDSLVRRGLAETHAALREYVAQVVATLAVSGSGSAADASSVALAARLLAPLAVRARDEAGPFDAEVTLASAAFAPRDKP